MKTNIISYSLILILSLVSCTKKRPESFSQGQGENLLDIAQFDGAEFEVETKQKLVDYNQNPQVSRAENVKIGNDKKTPVLNQDDKKSTKMTKEVSKQSETDDTDFSAVKIDTKADLVGDTPFVALANRKNTYKIRYRINDDFLVVMKVAQSKHVHISESAGAFKKDKSDEIEVPLVGYPIKGFFRVENVDQNGEKSNKLIELPKQGKSDAKFFRIDRNAKVLYKLQEKMDLFRKTYFTGEKEDAEWYYAETVVGTSVYDTMYNGWALSQSDRDGNGLSKVKFVLNRTELRAISVNLDSRINIKDDSNQVLLVKIPIEWKDYAPAQLNKLNKEKSNFAMTEEDVKDTDWAKREYIKLDFEKTYTDSFSDSTVRFVDLELAEKYFSFSLYFPDSKIRVKYSFLKDEGRAKFQRKQMFQTDAEKYGFFTTKKHEFDNFEKFKKKDYGKNEFLNRFNVNNPEKEIRFFFAAGSDKKLIPAAEKACEEWTQAFQAAGVDLKIIADTTKEVALGDIRYNVINLVRSTNETGLFGYGPSITDPRTGEIISATSNIHVTSIQAALAGYIREYIYHRSGVTAEANVGIEPLPMDLNGGIKGNKAFVSESSNVDKLIKKIPVVRGSNDVQLFDIEKLEPTKKQKAFNNRMWGREFDLGVTGKYLNEDIEKECKDVVELADKLKVQRENKTEPAQAIDDKDDSENKMVLACADKLVPHKMIGTLLHEMGHNFGLRHNFYGSVDKENFLPVGITNTKEQVKSSSVMEYPSFNEDRLMVIGPYDIEAIRFGYADSLTKIGTNVVQKLDPKLSVEDNMKVNNFTPARFKFCTDEHIEVDEDPLCARHDSGTNAEEIVNSKIQDYNTSIAKYNFRYDRHQGIDPMRLTQARINRYWLPLKRIYDEWRFKLNDHLGPGKEYLDNYTAKKLNEDVADKEASDPEFKSYRKAAKQIFKFALQIAQLPPRYCIGTRNGKLAAVEFSEVRKKVQIKNKVIPETCMDSLVMDMVNKENGFIPDYESGFELDDVRFDMKIKPSSQRDYWGNILPEPPDVIGLMPEKMIAVSVLTARNGYSQKHIEAGMRPNLMDEPEMRDEVLEYLADRLSKGIDGKKLTKPAKGKTAAADVFFEKFKFEKKYIDHLVYSVISEGLSVPDKDVISKRRKIKFAVKHTDRSEVLDKAKYKVKGSDSTNFFALVEPEATETKKLMQKIESLPKRIESAVPIGEETFTELYSIAKTMLSESDQSIEPFQFAKFFKTFLENEIVGVSRSPEQKKSDINRVHWKKIFEAELEVMKPVLHWINTDITDAATSYDYYYDAIKRQCATLKERRAGGEKNFSVGEQTPICEMLIRPGYTLNQATLDQRIKSYIKETSAKGQQQKSDDEYEIYDLQAQYEMIMSVLRRMSYEFN